MKHLWRLFEGVVLGLPVLLVLVAMAMRRR